VYYRQHLSNSGNQTCIKTKKQEGLIICANRLKLTTATQRTLSKRFRKNAKKSLFNFVALCSDILLEDNAVLVARLSEKALPTKEYFQFMTSDGFGNIMTDSIVFFGPSC